MKEHLRLITELIDSLNMYRYLGGASPADYFVVPAMSNDSSRKVFVYFSDWEYRDALFLLLDSWDWCEASVKDSTIIVTLYND